MDTLNLFICLAWRNLWRNGRRTLLTMVAIILAVASMVSLGSFMTAWNNSTLDVTIENLTGHIQIHAPGYLDDPNIEHSMAPINADLKAYLQAAPVIAWSERVRLPAMIRTERESSPVELLGINPAAELGLSFISGAVVQGHYFNDAHERGILIGKTLMDRLQTKAGRRVVVMSQGINGQIRELGTPVVGVFRGAPEMERSVAFITLPRAQNMMGLGSHYFEISLKVDDTEALPEVVKALQKRAPELDIRAWDELQPFTKAMLEMSEGSILIWILVSFSVVAFGLVNTLLMAVYERMREFGLLQALGMRPGWLLLQVLLESLMLVGAATLAGLLVGALIVLGYQDGLDLGSWGSGATYFGASSVLYPKLVWEELLYIGTVVLVLGVLASLYPAYRASRYVPVEVLNKAIN
ncbi:MAG: ABC transporter permease [Pontibacterium sp.]